MKLARHNGRAEIFRSIQGEGVTAGTESVFVRLSLCNLYCRWCDTDYTWNWRGTPFAHDRDAEDGYAKYRKDEQIVERTPEQVCEEVVALGATNVVLTGGEPLLQQGELAMLASLIRARGAGHRFEVETNGTIVPTPALDEHVGQYNVSPKLANSGVRQSLRVREAPLAFFAATERAWFKFVVTAPGDLDEIEEVVRAHGIARERVLVMGEGTTPDALDERGAWLGRACAERGWRLTDRLHVREFGARRGV